MKRNTIVRADNGQRFEFVGHRRVEWGRTLRVAVWTSPCRTCGTSFEVTSPQTISPYPIKVQMAYDSGAWRSYFSLVRCKACRPKRWKGPA